MTGIIIKVLLGLFVWGVLLRLIYKKRKYKKNTQQYFVNIYIKIIGVTVVFFAGMDFVKMLLNFK